jgi:hypothetical protein
MTGPAAPDSGAGAGTGPRPGTGAGTGPATGPGTGPAAGSAAGSAAGAGSGAGAGGGPAAGTGVAPAGRRSWFPGGIADLLLGARLAVCGGRSGWGRMLLTVAGIAVGVLVLLFAASVNHAVQANQARSQGLAAQLGSPSVPGVDPLYLHISYDEFHGEPILVSYVHAGGRNVALPPGVDRLPGPGEAVVSPALADRMSTSDGQLLRSRYPQRVVGRIGRAGLDGPADKRIYLGAADPTGDRVYGWGQPSEYSPVPPLLWALLVVGVAVLLFPVFVFVATSARLADAERDRRLGTFRLIGASSAQVRRVAAGESLVAAVVGLVAGAGLFLAARRLVEGQTVVRVTLFASDVVPAWPLVVLVAAAVPALAVGSALFALRHAVIEPLGVVRQASPARRRLWWRPLPALAGAALLLYLIRARGSGSGDRPVAVLSAGVVLLLLGIPTVLPWALHRALRWPRDETPALQLATRRLWLDSGTPARVVSGVGVVLAGAIGLSSLLAAAADRYRGPGPFPAGMASVDFAVAATGDAGRTAATLTGLPGVTAAHELRELAVHTGPDVWTTAEVGSCAAFRSVVALPSCVDGQVFLVGGAAAAGQPVRIESEDAGRPGVPWRIPAGALAVPPPQLGSALFVAAILVTPAALPPGAAALARGRIDVRYDPDDEDAVERIRTAVAPLRWQATVATSGAGLSHDDRTFRTLRHGLFAGALLTLGLAGATLLAAAVDQVRQQRWPLAALAASGVPRAMLARSLLWQTAIPMLFAVLVADLTGVVLGVLVPPVVDARSLIDWTGIAAFSAVAVAVVTAVSALTLPSVRQATRPTSLRSE